MAPRLTPDTVVTPLFLFKLSRPYFWLVTFWLYLLPTGQRWDLWSSVPFWFGLAYSTLPLNLLCYLMNDLSDIEVDKHNPRKGGPLLGIRAGAGSLWAAVRWTAAVQVPFLLFFAASFGVARCAAWFAAVVLVNWLYNFGPRLSGNYAPLDLLCPCGYMLVVPLSCWLNGLPLPPGRAWAHMLFFVVRSQLWIQTFDVQTDRASGRRTTAVLLGHRGAQRLLGLLLAAELSFVLGFFSDWALRSFSAASLGLLGVQVALQARQATEAAQPTAATINATFAGLGLGGYGLLVQVWLNGSFNERVQGLWF